MCYKCKTTAALLSTAIIAVGAGYFLGNKDLRKKACTKLKEKYKHLRGG